MGGFGTTELNGQWRRVLHRICDEHGLHRISPHALPQTYATLALQTSESMVTMKAPSDRLGHSIIALTLDKHADALPNHDRKRAIDVARLWHGSKSMAEVRRRQTERSGVIMPL